MRSWRRKTDKNPIHLNVERQKDYRDVAIDYHDGPRYPHLVKVGTGETGLDKLLAPQVDFQLRPDGQSSHGRPDPLRPSAPRTIEWLARRIGLTPHTDEGSNQHAVST